VTPQLLINSRLHTTQSKRKRGRVFDYAPEPPAGTGALLIMLLSPLQDKFNELEKSEEGEE
jgi:hypothetical protein